MELVDLPTRGYVILEVMEPPHMNVGRIGERAVANHLIRKGYVLHGTNYRKRWGEIDLVMKKEQVVHFIEVKTVSCDTDRKEVSYETWLPEENVSTHKLQKLFRTIETWLLEHKYEGEWQLDVAAVWIDQKNRRARIKMIENITSVS